MVLSLGFLFIFLSSNLYPQFVQVSLKPNETEPQLSHVFILVLKELKNINNKSNNNTGIRNKINKTPPKKFIKKLNPKTGKAINTIKE